MSSGGLLAAEVHDLEGKLGYTEAYFSRVINGKDRLTAQFRGRCQVRLGCPDDVWTEE